MGNRHLKEFREIIVSLRIDPPLDLKRSLHGWLDDVSPLMLQSRTIPGLPPEDGQYLGATADHVPIAKRLSDMRSQFRRAARFDQEPVDLSLIQRLDDRFLACMR